MEGETKTNYTRRVENPYYNIACEDLKAAECSLRALDKFQFRNIGNPPQLYLSKGENNHISTGFFWVTDEQAKELSQMIKEKLKPSRAIAIQKLKDVVNFYENENASN